MKPTLNLLLALSILIGNSIIGMEPAAKELPIAAKEKDKKEHLAYHATRFADAYDKTAKNIEKGNFHNLSSSIKVLEKLVQQRHQEIMEQSKLLHKLLKLEDPKGGGTSTMCPRTLPHKNTAKNKLLSEQFDAYQRAIDTFTHTNAQLIAFHQALLATQYKNHKAQISQSKENEKKDQEYAQKIEEIRLINVQEQEQKLAQYQEACLKRNNATFGASRH
ncbi:hypothetical protein BH09DEP1_BH09DEP1_0260 [soil metagenome]